MDDAHSSNTQSATGPTKATQQNDKTSSQTKRNYNRLDFTLEQEEQIIDFVRHNPALHNPKESLYKNKNYRDRMWNELGTKINKAGMSTNNIILN